LGQQNNASAANGRSGVEHLLVQAQEDGGGPALFVRAQAGATASANLDERSI
jgi:hypothetical protein